MDKQAFLGQLGKKLVGLPHDEIAERLAFYSEVIDDRMEEGLSEDEAVAAAGSVDELTSQVITDSLLVENIKMSNAAERRLSPQEILLLILGSPIWLSLLVAAVAMILSLYVSLWAVFGSLVGCAFGGIGAGIFLVCRDNTLSGVAILGAGILCSGISIFLFYSCKAASVGTISLTKKATLRIKNRFVKKEDA